MVTDAPADSTLRRSEGRGVRAADHARRLAAVRRHSPDAAHPAADENWSLAERLGYHSRFVVLTTPAMERISLSLRRLMLLNRRQQGTARWLPTVSPHHPPQPQTRVRSARPSLRPGVPALYFVLLKRHPALYAPTRHQML